MQWLQESNYNIPQAPLEGTPKPRCLVLSRLHFTSPRTLEIPLVQVARLEAVGHAGHLAFGFRGIS